MGKGKNVEKWKGDGTKPARRQATDPATTAVSDGVRAVAVAMLGLCYLVSVVVLGGLVAAGLLDGAQFIEGAKYMTAVWVVLAISGNPRLIKKLVPKRVRRAAREILREGQS